MFLRIRPGLALVWRSPSDVQVGAPDPVAVAEGVTGGLDWALARLRSGTTLAQAVAAATRHGATVAEVDALVDALSPALVEVDAAGAPLRPSPGAAVAVRVAAAGRDEPHDPDVLLDACRDRGLAARRLDDAAWPEPGEVLVELADYVVPPRRVQPLMAHDVAHLAVVVGDHGVTVSPVVRPGRTPCLRCADLHHIDRDVAWATVAPQLVARRAPTPPVVAMAVAATIAARAIAADASGDGGLVAAEAPGASGAPAAEATGYELDLATGAATPVMWQRHPECGCQGLPGSATPPADDHVRHPSRS